MSILDDNICEHFEESLSFIKCQWVSGWPLQHLWFSQMDAEFKPIVDKCEPHILYYIRDIGNYPKKFWIGSKDKGFIRISEDKFKEFINYVNT